jgi:hypothetical protein
MNWLKIPSRPSVEANAEGIDIWNTAKKKRKINNNLSKIYIIYYKQGVKDKRQE